MKSGGCKYFGLVSSESANPASWFLYPQVKGQLEEGIKGLGFERLTVFRPGLLLCDRKESRPFEWLAQRIVPVFDKVTGGRLCIATDVLARAIIVDASQGGEGVPFTLLHNKEILSKVIY